ncbi:MAG: hypothetical protein V3U86_08590 [Acidobacteriota bacterium]
MKVIAKNVVALIVGILIGGIINMALIIVSPFVIPPPEGVDVTSAESLRSSIHLFEPRHFLFPFLAHALGALAGAIFAALMAATHRSRFALAVGVVFLFGGIANMFMIPAPIWFVVLDLVGAYIPMAYFGYTLADGLRKSFSNAVSN